MAEREKAELVIPEEEGEDTAIAIFTELFSKIFVFLLFFYFALRFDIK